MHFRAEKPGDVLDHDNAGSTASRLFPVGDFFDQAEKGDSSRVGRVALGAATGEWRARRAHPPDPGVPQRAEIEGIERSAHGCPAEMRFIGGAGIPILVVGSGDFDVSLTGHRRKSAHAGKELQGVYDCRIRIWGFGMGQTAPYNPQSGIRNSKSVAFSRTSRWLRFRGATRNRLAYFQGKRKPAFPEQLQGRFSQ